MALYTVHDRPGTLNEPVLVVHLEGWIDAGNGGSGAMNALLNTLEVTPVASFHVDHLLDQRARRPVLKVVNGVNTSLSWPKIQLVAGQDRSGRDLLLLHGPEPDFQWRGFARDVRDLGAELGVRLVVGLGAFPSPVPHTRPVPVVAAASDSELAQRVGFIPGAQEVPCSVQAVLERGFAGAGIPAIGLWARVPHYAAPAPYPEACLALVETLARLGGLDLDVAELRLAAEDHRQQLDALVAATPEYAALVERLEGDQGDALAAEVERFLKEQE